MKITAAAGIDHENSCNWDGYRSDDRYALCLDHGGTFALADSDVVYAGPAAPLPAEPLGNRWGFDARRIA